MDKKFLYKIITVLLPVLALGFYFLSGYLLRLMNLYIPPCIIYTAYDTYCPACGNTRSVTALLKGDILTAIRFNIVPILLLFIGLLAYIELAVSSFGIKLRLLPRSLRFYLIVIVLLVFYFIIRNFFPFLTP